MTNLDKPGVLAPLPLILLASLGISAILGYLVPLNWLPGSMAAVTLIPGAILFCLAGFLGISGIVAFRRAGTNIEPHKPALVLVRDGPYRFTRNPMYLGLITLHLSIVLLASLDWGVILLPAFALTLHFGVVLREEKYLTEKFGEPYSDFLAKTRRWI